MNIGVFVPNNESLHRLQSLLKTYKNVSFTFYPYENITELKTMYEKNYKWLDGYFFSGLFAYLVIKQAFKEFKKPVTYVKISEADFYKKLFEIQLHHPEVQLNKVFIDFHLESKKIEQFITEQDEANRPYKIKREDIYITDDAYERMFQIHEDLHKSGAVKWSFTRFANITHLLQERQFNYFYFTISNETIHHTLMQLIDEINLQVLQGNQMVCGYLSLSNVDEGQKEIKNLNLHSLLLDYTYKEVNHLMIHNTNSGFELVTNYAMLENITDNFRACSLLHYLSKYLKETIHIGWGSGKTFIQAQTNAKQAWQYSVNNELNSTYIVKDDGIVKGPLLGEEITDSDVHLLADHSTVEKLQVTLQMTRDKLNKIFLAFYQVDTEHMTSLQFAEAIGLSVRSANRILKEAEEKGLVTVTYDTASGLQGRPRKLYRLNKKLVN